MQKYRNQRPGRAVCGGVVCCEGGGVGKVGSGGAVGKRRGQAGRVGARWGWRVAGARAAGGAVVGWGGKGRMVWGPAAGRREASGELQCEGRAGRQVVGSNQSKTVSKPRTSRRRHAVPITETGRYCWWAGRGAVRPVC